MQLDKQREDQASVISELRGIRITKDALESVREDFLHFLHMNLQW